MSDLVKRLRDVAEATGPNEARQIALDAADRIEELEAENARLRKWAALGEHVMDGWPEIGDIDGFSLESWAVKCGVLVEIPGGYDPDHHIDSVGIAPERGDPWFEIIASP